MYTSPTNEVQKTTHTVAIRSNAGISDLIELFAARFEVSAPDEESYRDLPAQYTIATE